MPITNLTTAIARIIRDLPTQTSRTITAMIFRTLLGDLFTNIIPIINTAPGLIDSSKIANLTLQPGPPGSGIYSVHRVVATSSGRPATPSASGLNSTTYELIGLTSGWSRNPPTSVSSSDTHWVSEVQVTPATLSVGTFRIPEMSTNQGPKGDPGNSPNPTGPWTSGRNYSVLDIVERNGNSYICRQDHVSSAANIPGNAPAVWMVSANKGDKGDRGSSFIFHNNWAPHSFTYDVNDVVTNNGSSYICIRFHISSTSNEPPNSIYWQTIANKGDTGDTGPQGLQGIQGDKGDQGVQGIQGHQGPSDVDIFRVFPTGTTDFGTIPSATGFTPDSAGRGTLTGLTPAGWSIIPQNFNSATQIRVISRARYDPATGNLSAFSSPAAEGQIGPAGPAGPRGNTGPKGDTGDTGPKGDTGDQGAIGPTGPAGMDGTDGLSLEPLGPWVANTAYNIGDIVSYLGSSYICLNNHTSSASITPLDTVRWMTQSQRGEAGARGLQGLQGIQGLQGDTGPAGPRGDTGPKGDTGDQGPRGLTGAQGATGNTGPTGPKGDTGDTGPKGDKGDQGDRGLRGEQGIQGIQGERGETGLGLPIPTIMDVGKIPTVDSTGNNYELTTGGVGNFSFQDINLGSIVSGRQWTENGNVTSTTYSRYNSFRVAQGDYLKLSVNAFRSSDYRDFAYDTRIRLTSGVINSSGISSNATNLFVLDGNNRTVSRYTLTGTFIDSFTLTTNNRSGGGIGVNATHIFIVDNDGNIYRYTLSGTFVDTISLNVNNRNPGGITVDSTNIYVVDRGANAVFIYTISGTFNNSFNLNSENSNPNGLAIYSRRIYVVDSISRHIYRYTTGGAYIDRFDLHTSNAVPSGISVNSSNIFISDRNDVFRYITPSGTIVVPTISFYNSTSTLNRATHENHIQGDVDWRNFIYQIPLNSRIVTAGLSIGTGLTTPPTVRKLTFPV